MGIIYLGGKAVGNIDSNGVINDGGASGARAIGHIDSDGKIWNEPYGGSIIGSVDSNGKVWNSGSGGSIIGSVDSNGQIWSNGDGGTVIGRIEGGQPAGGAAVFFFRFGTAGRSSRAEESDDSGGCGDKAACEEAFGKGILFVVIALFVIAFRIIKRIISARSTRIGAVIGLVLSIVMCASEIAEGKWNFSQDAEGMVSLTVACVVVCSLIGFAAGDIISRRFKKKNNSVDK
ncbi:hypothetical protein R80B4_01694 [Fibrobacteres bacterium R8-0-B4]